MSPSENDIQSQQPKTLDHSQYLGLVETVAGIGYWRVDLINDNLFWSDEVYKIHGLTPEQHTPEFGTAIEFYHVDDRAKVETAILKTIETKEPFEFELRLITHDGSQKHVHAKGVAESNENRETTHIFGIFQDITERIQRERSHLLEQQVHKSFVEQSHDGYWDWYINENYIYISPCYWHMCSRTFFSVI